MSHRNNDILKEVQREKLTEDITQRMAKCEFVGADILRYSNRRSPQDIKPETWIQNKVVREWLRTPDEFERVSFYNLD